MINRKGNFFLGIFIILIPFLGLPTSWKTALIIISGFFLVGMSIKLSLPKKITKVRAKKEKMTPVFVENAPIFTNEISPERSEKVKSLLKSDIK